MGSSALPKTGLMTLLSSFERYLKARYLGIGFVWAWIYCSYDTSAIYSGREGVGINADPSWLASATTVVIVLIAGGIVLRNRDLTRLAWMPLVAPLSVAIGTLLSGLAPLTSLPPEPLALISGIMTGSGSGMLYLLWGQTLSRLDIEQIEVVIPASSFVTLLCSLVFPYIGGLLGLVAVATLPLISGFLLLVCLRDKRPARTLPSAPEALDKPATAAVLRISLVLAASYFIIGCLGALSEPRDQLQVISGFDASTFIGSGFGLVLAIAFILFSSRIDFSSLFRWLCPLLVLAIALFPWHDVIPDFISSTILSIGDTSLQVITCIYVIVLAKRRLIPAILGIGLSQGFVQLGVLAGNLFGVRLAEPTMLDSPGMTALMLALICLLCFSTLLIPTRETLRAMPAPRPTADTDDHKSYRDHVCALLSQRHGLSTRESEVLAYLAKGRSQPYIREELLLSKNTIATHVKHIYQKLGVHSRQELLDLFETS